jgi:hypothetical protein
VVVVRKKTCVTGRTHTKHKGSKTVNYISSHTPTTNISVIFDAMIDRARWRTFSQMPFQFIKTGSLICPSCQLNGYPSLNLLSSPRFYHPHHVPSSQPPSAHLVPNSSKLQPRPIHKSQQQSHYSPSYSETHSRPILPERISRIEIRDASPSAIGERASSTPSTSRIDNAATVQTDSQSYYT